MSNKNLDGKYGIRYGIFAPPLAEQLKEQGYRFPDKKTEDKFENANKAISTIHMAVLITDEEWEKILDRFHNALIREAVEMKKEKKWRAFKDIEEFKKETGLGLLSIVRYRYIIGEPRIITTTGVGVITEFRTCCGTYYITIGDALFNLDELFTYEYFADNEWKPFGVAEE